MRITLDLRDEQIGELEILARQSGKSCTQMVQDVLMAHLAANRVPISSFKGLWANNPETQDVQGYLDKLRSEWTR